jgi:hypothetical protein
VTRGKQIGEVKEVEDRKRKVEAMTRRGYGGIVSRIGRRGRGGEGQAADM